MKKVGILGGTFDPPHNGHLLIANEVLHTLGFDEIWFMPNQEPPHKQKLTNSTNEDRIKMLELAIEGHPGFILEKIELTRTGPSYTYDTMKVLTEMYPTIAFYFIIGADMIEYLPKWFQIDKLIKLVTFVGVQRPNFRIESPYPLVNVDIPAFDVSSSMIRKRLKSGETVRYLLPEPVRLYIKENKLYES